MKEITKKYTNEEMTILWQPSKCIHSAVCVKMLPKVYDPKARPWMTMENATTDELKPQVDKCPSGALSYFMNDAKQKEEEIMSELKIDIIDNGPLMVHGNIVVCDSKGNKASKENRTAFCRCGHSENKPYCDGAHKAHDFIG